MRRSRPFLVISLVTMLTCFLGTVNAFAAAKTHTIVFGKWVTVSCSGDCENPADNKSSILKLRPLLVDTRIKEFTFGIPHDVTDRVFVVRRAFRINDSLPQEANSPLRWQWQLGGWLLVDRVSGHISALNLADFDAACSLVSWYRDYAAYCGLSDDGKTIYAVVVQVNRRKPLVKNLLRELKPSKDLQNEERVVRPCPAPEWQRSPARVTFEHDSSVARTFVIRGHAADLLSDEPEEEEASK
jgi:hypothetical protein